MYKISQITLPVDFVKENLKEYIASKIKISAKNIIFAKLNRLSIDARDKRKLCYKSTIVFDTNTKINVKKYKNIEVYCEENDSVGNWNTEKKTIVVGSGPSGLFACLRLVESGARNITLIERGYEMEKRMLAVNALMDNGILDTKSNIQFGEGGAGTFSDGKLNTGIKSKHITKVLKTFHKFGAHENILYDARPHIGTDVLSNVIVNIREYLKSNGVTILFEHKMEEVVVENNELKYIIVDTLYGKVKMNCDYLILAIGHSSRDTIRMLYDKQMDIKQKPFSMGYRIEHLAECVRKSQYGDGENSKLLPPADYHIVEHVGNRAVYSFCMCPGGVVVPAMSEEKTVVTNGMSYNARDGINSNSAILVNINASDFPSDHPLSGIDMQEKYEKFAYKKSGSYKAIVQKVGDFLEGRETKELGKVIPSYRPDYMLGRVDDMMPEFIVKSIRTAIPQISKKFKFFEDKDAILTGVETRSSAPYQIVRNENMESNIKGIYAIGEGAGFAGGIVSSAVEGIKCADIIIVQNS